MYGNILNVLSTDSTQISLVINLLKEKSFKFQQLNTMFFIETQSIKQTEQLNALISGLSIPYLFYHNNISDGSVICSSGVDASAVAAINKIMLQL